MGNFIKKKIRLLILFVTILIIPLIGSGTDADALDINFIISENTTINNIKTNFDNVIITSKEIKNIDDSNALDKFTHLKGFKNINFDVSSSKDFNADKVEEVYVSSGDKVETTFKLNNLEIKTEYKGIDTSFFNTNQKPIKQTYIVKNLLDEKRDIKLNIKYEFDSDVVTWNGTKYVITEEPKYFETFYTKGHFPEINEPYLTGYILYFGDTSYFNFRDITRLNYGVSIYSENNKNYIDLEINFDIDSLGEFLIDPEIGWTTRIVSTSTDYVLSVFAIDVDGDTDIDVLSASMHDDRVAWYENDGNSPPNWTKRNITTSADATVSVYAIDVDGDTDIDVLSADRDADRVAWYENNASLKLKILAVPLNWQDTQIEFDNNVDTQIDFFLNDIPLNDCRELVLVKKLDVNTQNLDYFTCSETDSGIDLIIPFIENLGIDPTDYDHIIGFINNTPCFPIFGASDRFKTAWVDISGSSFLASHEIGHFYGLEDEYCSNPAGSSHCNCNDAGKFGICTILYGYDENPLDVNLECNATAGGSCCGSAAGLPECSNVNYDVCCLGNINTGGIGRAIMSYVDAPGPRRFDDYSITHLSSFSQLNCDGSGTPEDIIDVNLIIYENDSIEDNWIFLTNGEKTIYNQSGNYSLLIYNNQSFLLFNQSLEISFGYNGPVSNGTNYSNISFTSMPFNFQIPYNSSMYELNLSHGDNVIYSNLLNFCNNNSTCEITENYETCPLDCPLDQDDNICIPACDGICDPDCLENVDTDCSPLDVHSLSDIYANYTERIFILNINNTACLTLNNVSWNLDTGETNISSIYNITLEALEDLIVYVDYNYTSSGNYTIVATGYGDNFTDFESINITI